MKNSLSPKSNVLVKEIKNILILVHGTFATRAKWVEPNSSLAMELVNELGENDTLLESVRWSGKNSQGERIIAARKLRSRISTLLRKHPGAKVHIVAHSHGGNIAIYALQGSMIGSAVSSLTCMGTPYLSAEPRTITNSVAIAIFAIVSGLTVLPFLIFAHIVAKFLPGLLQSSIPMQDDTETLAGLCAILILFGGWKWFMWLVRRGTIFKVVSKLCWHIYAHQYKVLVGYLQQPIKICLLNIFVPKDEAHLYLRLINFFTEFPYLAYSLFSRLGFTAINWLGEKKRILWFSAILLCFCVWLSMLPVPSPMFSEKILTAYLLVLCFPFYFPFAMITTAVLGSITSQLRATKIGYGDLGPTDSMFLDVHSNQIPNQAPIEYENLVVHPSDLFDIKRTSILKHSSLYECPLVISRIVNFIRKSTDRTTECSQKSFNNGTLIYTGETTNQYNFNISLILFDINANESEKIETLQLNANTVEELVPSIRKHIQSYNLSDSNIRPCIRVNEIVRYADGACWWDDYTVPNELEVENKLFTIFLDELTPKFEESLNSDIVQFSLISACKRLLRNRMLILMFKGFILIIVGWVVLVLFIRIKYS